MRSSTSKPQPDEEAGDAAARASAEMEAVVRAGTRLERQGKLDAAALARVDAQLRDISARLDKDLADRLAAIEKRFASRRPGALPPAWRIPFLVVVSLVAGGALLEATVGDGFIVAGGGAYRRAMPWLFGILIPPLAGGWFFLEKGTHSMRAQAPTAWVRWLFMFPLMVGLTASAVVASPLGWAALLGWVVGEPAHVAVTVVSVESPSRRSRGCDQRARLAFEGSAARICLEGRVSGPVPPAGAQVTASGRLSRWGLAIDSIGP